MVISVFIIIAEKKLSPTHVEITLSTLMDALEDAQQPEGNSCVELARFGAGEVSINDVLVARAASGIILTYGVSIDKEAQRRINVK